MQRAWSGTSTRASGSLPRDIARGRSCARPSGTGCAGSWSRSTCWCCPTVPLRPFPVEQPYPTELDGKPVGNYIEWAFLTYAITVTGLPAISVPAGFTRGRPPGGDPDRRATAPGGGGAAGGGGVRGGRALGGPDPARRRGARERMRPRGFRILSANLANGRADADAFAALVEAAEPDVVTVQELVPEHADALARLLPFGKLEPARDHNGMGIALKAAGSVRLLQLPYRSAFVAELPWPEDDEPIEVLNVHLAAPHVPPVVQRILDRRGQVRAHRRPSRRDAPAPPRAGGRPQRHAPLAGLPAAAGAARRRGGGRGPPRAGAGRSARGARGRARCDSSGSTTSWCRGSSPRRRASCRSGAATTARWSPISAPAEGSALLDPARRRRAARRIDAGLGGCGVRPRLTPACVSPGQVCRSVKLT